jgi:DNA-binding response OmpR family regulator
MAYVLIVDTQAELRQHLVRLLEEAGHRTTAVAAISEATSLLDAEVPDLLATDAGLIDGASGASAKHTEAAGAKILMMTGSPDRIIEFDGAGQPYFSSRLSPKSS